MRKIRPQTLANGQRPKEKPVLTRKCIICKESIRLDDKGAHAKTVHPEYHDWQKKWLRNFLLVLTPALATLVYLLLVVFPCDQACQRGDPFTWGGFYAIMGYVGVSSIVLLRSAQKLREFRKKWTEERGGAIQP